MIQLLINHIQSNYFGSRGQRIIIYHSKFDRTVYPNPPKPPTYVVDDGSNVWRIYYSNWIYFAYTFYFKPHKYILRKADHPELLI